MNLKTITDESLLSQTKACVGKEREMTLLVLHHLKEVERRRLFASLGYSSLFDYATRELGYDPSSACRRIDAMRLLKDFPELEEKIESGKLTLSTAARAQGFFKKEDVTPERKKEIVSSLENKTTREVEKHLLGLASVPENHLHERIKPVTAELSEVKFYADDDLLKDLEKLRGLLAHAHPEMTISELIAYLAKMGIQKLDPAKEASLAAVSEVPSPSSAFLPTSKISSSAQNRTKRQARTTSRSNSSRRSRYIPKELVRRVWKRDGSQCTWKSPTTGAQCRSTYRLQVDHIQAFALGGPHSFDNLRLLCFHHNQLEAEALFGKP